MKNKKLAVLLSVIAGCGLLAAAAGNMGTGAENIQKNSRAAEENAGQGHTEDGQTVDGQVAESNDQTASEETTAPVYEYEIRKLPEPKYPEPAEHFAGGTGIAEDPYQIADAAQLALMAARINDKESNKTFGGAYYILTEDIALNDVTDFEAWPEKEPEYSWKTAGDGSAALEFSGNFNGNGHTISGLYINENNDDDLYARAYGLFGRVSGKVHDLTLDQSYIAVSGYSAEVGAVAGSLADKGVIDKCISRVKLETYDGCCGGIAGKLEGGFVAGMEYAEDELPTYSVIRNCKFEGTIEQKKDDSLIYVGGIAGMGGGHLVSCVNKGTIRFGSADADSVGGMIGMLNDGMIAGCENAGFLECRLESDPISADVGGIAGELYLSGIGGEKYMSRGILVRNCKNTGLVSGKDYVGGIAGNAANDGNDWCLSMDSCVNQGEVSAAEFTGGMIGRLVCDGDNDNGSNLVIQDCVNEMDITAGNVGGIVGHFTSISGAAVIRNCDNSGNLTAKSQNAAGVIAHWVMDGEPDIRILIEACDNSGDIVSDLNAGGIFSFVDQPAVLSAPEKTAVVIQECTNGGDIKTTANNSFIGGIVGSIGLKDIPVVFASCTNSGDLIIENEPTDVETQTEQKTFTISRIAGGIVGRVGSGQILTTDTNRGNADNPRQSNARITFAGCKNTGKLNVAAEDTVNEEGEPIYKNWFGGIIGKLCGEDGYAVYTDSCSYKHFERGLGNEDYPDAGEKMN